MFKRIHPDNSFPPHSNALRWVLNWAPVVGGVVLLLVAHTVRNEAEAEVIRIISARKASRKERVRYDQNRKKESL